MRIIPLLALLCVSATGCGGDEGSSLGGACSQSGATSGQCAAGGVCGAHTDGDPSLRCLKECTQQSDCGAGEDCNGVDGTNVKGCRLKAVPSNGSSGSGAKT